MAKDLMTADEEAPELPPPTAPSNIPVNLRGFADTESAERFGHVIAETVRAISSVANLERLDGITVAYDYDDALAQLDRGFQPSRPLTRTSTEEIAGVAMAAPVVRNRAVKSHLVFHAPFVLPLESEENTEEFWMALYMVAHECGHVDDLKHRDEAFPNVLLQRQVTDVQDSTLEPISFGLWDEYAACRLSAPFGRHQTAIYEQSFNSVLSVAKDKANASIRSYRTHANLGQVIAEAGEFICKPLKLSAYLLGHLDGLGGNMDDVPQARDLIAKTSYAVFIERLHAALQDLWSRRGTWASYAEFDVLKDIVRDLLADGGMILTRMPDGRMHVDIPFTRETMP
jgi:hypothetical protein